MNKMNINLTLLKSLVDQLSAELAEAEKVEKVMSNEKSEAALTAIVAAFSKARGLASTVSIEASNIENDFKGKISMMLNPGQDMMALMSALLPKDPVEQVAQPVKDKKNSN